MSKKYNSKDAIDCLELIEQTSIKDLFYHAKYKSITSSKKDFAETLSFGSSKSYDYVSICILAQIWAYPLVENIGEKFLLYFNQKAKDLEVAIKIDGEINQILLEDPDLISFLRRTMVSLSTLTQLPFNTFCNTLHIMPHMNIISRE